MFELIWEALKKIWEYIEKIVVKVLNFFNHIVDWFRDPERLRKLQSNKDIIAVSIREKLESGDYNVVNCLFNKKTNQIEEINDAVCITAEELDAETQKHFGDKDMIVLQ